MHATRRLPPGPGATLAPPITSRTTKIDRLDLLARTIHLSDRCVATAFSEENRANWDALLDQAEVLGQQWAITDPTDAHQLLKPMLASLSAITERFERGYDHVASATAWSDDGQSMRHREAVSRMPSDGICDTCDTDVMILVRDFAADESAEACPCCGQRWDP